MGRYKFLIVAIVIILLLIATELLLPKPVSWHVSLSSNESVPFGTSVLKDRIQDIFPNSEVRLSRKQFFDFESGDSRSHLVISQFYSPDPSDFRKMMHFIDSSGSNVLISAYQHMGLFADSLGVFIEQNTPSLVQDELNFEEDSARMVFNFNGEEKEFTYRRLDAPFSFVEDSVRTFNWSIFGRNADGAPVAIRKSFGAGKLILTTTPLIFSNYYMLYTDNTVAAASLLSMLPDRGLHWTEYYMLGRGEPLTPLRYVLATPPLKWAYYVLIILLILFVLFEAKRKQRAIPVIAPPSNESLNFVRTVGNLYFEEGSHKNIAEKKINYVLDHIRSNYYLQTSDLDDPNFRKQLSEKSGSDIINVDGLMVLIGIVRRKDKIDETELRDLNKKIEAFLRN